jgi:hypothetical protein
MKEGKGGIASGSEEPQLAESCLPGLSAPP